MENRVTKNIIALGIGAITAPLIIFSIAPNSVKKDKKNIIIISIVGAISALFIHYKLHELNSKKDKK